MTRSETEPEHNRQNLHPAPNPSVTVEELGTEVCLYRPDLDEVLVLNSSAADVWRLADGSMSTAVIAAALAQAFDAEPSIVQQDVGRIVDDLVERGFLVWQLPPAKLDTED
jgi:hypothetical protein